MSEHTNERTETHACDCISRQAAIVQLSHNKTGDDDCDVVVQNDIETIKVLPPAQPETDGFCTDCKEYDSERHFCPRFDRVIKTTIDEMKAEQRWIPCSERLPVEGESVLLCDRYGDMTLGRLVQTDEGYKWDIYAWWNDIDDWNAWMPIPEPYKEEGETE